MEENIPAGRFYRSNYSETGCPTNYYRSVLNSHKLALNWTMEDMLLSSANVTFRLQYRLSSEVQLYQITYRKKISRECNLWLSSQKSELSSEDLFKVGDCQIWLLNRNAKKGVVLELTRLNVPCSRGFLLFSNVHAHPPRNKKQSHLCGKIEEIPVSERIVYFPPSSFPAFLDIRGSPKFTLTYGLVDQCYNLTFLSRNGSYQLYATSELECIFKIHLPYGNRIVLSLEAGNGSFVENYLESDDKKMDCKGILTEIFDGKTSWLQCTESVSNNRTVEIVSAENRVEIKVTARSEGLGLEFRMSYRAEPIKEIVGPCDFGWISLSHLCATVVESVRLPWSQAETECVKRGGHLVSITSDYSEAIIENLLLNSPGYQEHNAFWIGATDKVHEGDFRWTDGSPFAYANWFPGWSQYNHYNRQPNDDGLSEQDCIELRRVFSLPTGINQITSFMWNDRDCGALNYFICEKFQNDESVIDPWSLDCNKSLALSQQHPSAVVTSPGFPRPYPDNIECKTDISAPTGYRLLLDFEELVLEDEPKCTYDYLEITEPANSSAETKTRRLCGDWSSKLKLLRYTSTSSKLILRFSTDYSHHFGGFKARVSMRNVKQCYDDRLQFFRSGCYLVVSYPEVTWTTAKHICKGIKAQLASVLSPEEETFISTSIRKSSEYRMGALYWLGAKEEANGQFVWIDGSPMSYSNWLPPSHARKINNSTEKPHCLSIQWTSSPSPSYPSGLYWRSHKCNATGGYICKQVREDHVYDVNFNRTVNGTEGRISTPKFPEHYYNDLDFTVHIIGPPRTRIVVEFDRIDLEYQPVCLYDYIQLVSLKGGGTEEPGAKLCGSYDTDMRRFDYVSLHNEMEVRFHSDYSITGTGFSLKWRAVDITGCPFQTLTSREGVIISPNYPFSLIPNLNCTITMLAPPKKRVWLEFQDFDIGDNFHSKNSLSPLEASAESTVLEIYLGKELSAIQPYAVEDLLTEGAFVSSGETLQITYRTGPSPSGRGFKAVYRIMHSVEEKRVISLDSKVTGLLRHLNYPAAAPANVNFLQHLIAPVGNIISMELYNVKLRETECSDDRGIIEVYDMYADTNGTMWRLCYEEDKLSNLKSPIAITSYVNTLCFRQKTGALGFPFNGSLKIHNDSNFKEKLRKHAQSAVDFCNPNPCEHEGKCISSADKNYCQCNGYFAGLFCGLTKCELNPCVFGTCELTPTSYKCQCEPGYSGQTCELKQKPCENNPCENRGVCIERGNNFHCRCHAWWEGPRCDKRMLHIPYKPLSQRMLEEPFWLGLITVTVVMAVIGLFWCAKRHFPEKIEKLLAEESDRNRSNLPSLRTSLREQLAASSGAAMTVVPSPGSGNPRTLFGRFGIRKPSILSLTSPRPNGYSPATARTFSLDDLLKPARRTPSPHKRNNSTPIKKNTAEKKQILQQLMTPTGSQQNSKETIQMVEKGIDDNKDNRDGDVKETKFCESGINISDPKLEKKVTFARLLSKISAEMSSASDVEIGIMKSNKLVSAFARSSSTPPSPAAETRSPNSTSSNQGSDTYSSSELAIPSTLGCNINEFLHGRKHVNWGNNRQKPASADSILAMFRNFSSASTAVSWPSTMKLSPSTTPTASSPQDDFVGDDESTSSIHTPVSFASAAPESPSKQGKSTIDVPVFDALTAQKSTSGGSNLLHPPTILLEIPSTINKCLSPIRELPTPLPSPMPSPALTPIMHRSRTSSVNDESIDSSEDKISMDVHENQHEIDEDVEQSNKDCVNEEQVIQQETIAIQEETSSALQHKAPLSHTSTIFTTSTTTETTSTTSSDNQQNHPLVIPVLTIQMPSPTHQLPSQLTLGSPPPQRSPFKLEDCPSNNRYRKSLKDMDKPISLDLNCSPPSITVTCNLSEVESDVESVSPAVKKVLHHNTSSTTMCYLSPFALGPRNDRTTSESNLSSSGYSSMASPGSSRCGSSNPLCPSEIEESGPQGSGTTYHQKTCRLKSAPSDCFHKSSENQKTHPREISDSETLSDDPLIESNDEGIGTDHIDEKIEEGEVKSAKELEVFITNECDSTKTLKVPSITNLSVSSLTKCCSLEANMDLLMPPTTKTTLQLPSIVIQSDASICDKHLSPVSSRSESPLSDKTTGLERFSPQFYGRNKDVLPFTDSDGLYDFPSSDKVNVTSNSQQYRKYTSRKKDKKTMRSSKTASPSRSQTTGSLLPQNLDISAKDAFYRVHPPRKTSPKRKPRGQQILSSSSSSDSITSPNFKFVSSDACSETVRWSCGNVWSNSKCKETSSQDVCDAISSIKHYPKSAEDLARPRRVSRLRAISHQIRFLRRLELSLRRRERTISPSDSLESEEDSPRATSPLIQPCEKSSAEMRKSRSINFSQAVVKNRRYKREDELAGDALQCKRVFVTGNGYSD